MVLNRASPTTEFSRDIVGRYICNTFDEIQPASNKASSPDDRPFDIIIVGGGSFGAVLAEHLFANDKARQHRILVLEGGPLALPEHVQNLALSGLNNASPTSIAELRGKPPLEQEAWRKEVWGLAWHSSTPFPGLAYAIGGRSIYWGGWSPRLLAGEMPIAQWSKTVVDDLSIRYFDEASRQIGTSMTNDFIRGPLHEALRQQLLAGINGNNVAGAIKPAQLPQVLELGPAATPQEIELSKLEAPLAVQSRVERSGYFVFNKFSGVPLLIRAARTAYNEPNGNNDGRKRLVIVPNCHVKRLICEDDAAPGGQTLKRVTSIESNKGFIEVPPGGQVVIALGTIESARLSRNSFSGIPNFNKIGQNLMAHLRSNLNIRIPKSAVQNLPPNITDLQASALFVKGQFQHPDNSTSYFHLQVTAAGLGTMAAPDSEAELFQKVPNIDIFDAFVAPNLNDQVVVITIRAIGQMEAQNPNSFVREDPELDEFSVPRAFVQIRPTNKDRELWDAMDRASDDVATIFADGNPFEVITKAGIVPITPGDDLSVKVPYTNSDGTNNLNRRDGIGSTHHETGTLWLGEDPTASITNTKSRFHYVTNTYAVGPAIFPTIGSPNPMLTGVALARRLGDYLIPPLPDDGFAPLFDGISAANWQMAGSGRFTISGGAFVSDPGNDLGLLWCTTPTPADFTLRLEWLRTRENDNSGIFVRFSDPNSKGYSNTAYVAVDFGFEVQIDELGRGTSPAGRNVDKKYRSTGAIYNEDTQNLTPQAIQPLGEWNEYEIQVQGQNYTVLLNGAQVTTFTNTNVNRGLPSTQNLPSFIGIQSHTGSVAFRNIRIK